jgi:hypothetical protein
MKERPILMSGPMVRAILDGRKTQTRRVIDWSRARIDGFHASCGPDGYDTVTEKTIERVPWNAESLKHLDCPYGVPGDRLWVRESFQPLLADGVSWNDSDYETGNGYAISYVATDGVKEFFDCPNDEAFCYRITPSIHMPRWASRITLEITDVRVQRVQEISEEDARAEGIIDGGCLNCGESEPCGCSEPKPSPVDGFVYLWDSINGKKYPWSSNPWTWALTFRRLA